MKKVIIPLALCLITAACGGDENDGKTEPEMKINSCYVVSSSSGQSENFPLQSACISLRKPGNLMKEAVSGAQATTLGRGQWISPYM